MSASPSWGARARASRRCSTSWAASTCPPPAPTSSAARTSAACPTTSSRACATATFGFVFQAFHLLKGLTIVENVELPDGVRRRAARRSSATGRWSCSSWSASSHRVAHRPSELSGGERQRVAIARALANRPKVLLADEPTGALDSKAQQAIIELFCTIHRTLGTTMIVVTHDPKVADDAGRAHHPHLRRAGGDVKARRVATVLGLLAPLLLAAAPDEKQGDFFQGFLVAANATDVYAPDFTFRVSGWNSTWGNSKLLELVEDGKR